LWIEDGKERRFVADPAAHVNEGNHETHFLLDLQNLAKHMMEKVGHSFFKIDASDGKPGPRVIRFTGPS